MTETFINPASTVDLIVPYNGGIVLVKRKYEPFKDCWALPGGFLEIDKETLEEAGARELFEEISLKANPKWLRLVGVYSEPRRDPRGHIIAHAYEVLIYSGKLKASDDAAEARVFIKLPNKLAFDHKKILGDYFKNKQLGEGI
jgi:8-oxo-dGTP diphosphatase